MKALDRRRLLTSGAAAAVLAASGIGAAAEPKRGGVLRLGLSGGDKTDRFVGPRKFGAFMTMAGVGCAFETLTEVSPDGVLRGELATAWEPMDHGAAWVITLRRDATFHDRRPLLADDVVFSLKRHAAIHSDVLPGVTAVRKLAPHRLRVDLSVPDVAFPLRLADPNIIVHPAQDWRDALARGAGTGLYRLDYFVAGHQFTARRVADHWKGPQSGLFDRIEGHAIETPEARLRALLRGDVDAIDLAEMGPALLAALPDTTLRHPPTTPAFAASPRLARAPSEENIAQRADFRFTHRWWIA